MSGQRFRPGLRAIHPVTGWEVIVLNPEHAAELAELAAKSEPVQGSGEDRESPF